MSCAEACEWHQGNIVVRPFPFYHMHSDRPTRRSRQSYTSSNARDFPCFTASNLLHQPDSQRLKEYDCVRSLYGFSPETQLSLCALQPSMYSVDFSSIAMGILHWVARLRTELSVLAVHCRMVGILHKKENRTRAEGARYLINFSIRPQTSSWRRPS